jgi:hypothetical protein
MLTFWMVSGVVVVFGLVWIVIHNAQVDDKRRKQSR